MKLDCTVVGYTKGKSKAGADYMRIHCTYNQGSSDKVDNVGKSVCSLFLMNDDLTDAMKATGGKFLNASVKVAYTYNAGKESYIPLEFIPASK